MLANANLVSANLSLFPYLPAQRLKLTSSLPTQTYRSFTCSFPKTVLKVSGFSEFCGVSNFALSKEVRFRMVRRALRSQETGEPVLEKGTSSGSELGSGGGNGGQGRDWTTSMLLFVLWGALIYYAFILSPNQTPSRDLYFLKKLLFLKGDDGFRMNQVLVSLWNMMGLWPLVYSMLLLPSGRSSSKVPVWPFLILSFFLGVYVLLPYFVLWNPPQPPVEETELRKWPLNFLESKVTAWALLAAGLGLIVYGGLAGGDDWKEFYQYFRESKLVHVTSIDFSLLSAFAPFWVYHDMTSRKWFDKGYWLLPLSLVPLLGPALYLLLRPSLTPVPVSTSKQE